ncbi:hypothetical protein NMG60_11028885 [Bertholletia excelsa]
MGRAPCCAKVGLHRGPWTAKEDALLTKYIQAHGEGSWRSLPKKAGLLRCGKSCRLRWMNYLRPDIKRGNITPDEDDLIIKMHALLGNRWSLIAGRLPGRTDNEIKNYWNTHLSKRLRSQGTDPNTHKKLLQPLARELKRRRSNNRKQKQKSNVNVEPEKLKVHNPKAIRITSLSFLSRNNSFDLAPRNEGVIQVPWSNFKKDAERYDSGVGFLINDDDQNRDRDPDILNGLDPLKCQTDLPMSDTNLEKLYEEYLQLLKTEDNDQVQLDSFAESLLI